MGDLVDVTVGIIGSWPSFICENPHSEIAPKVRPWNAPVRARNRRRRVM